MGMVFALLVMGASAVAAEPRIIAVYQSCDETTCVDTWSACDVAPVFEVTIDRQFVAWCHDDATVCQGELSEDVLHCDMPPTFERRILHSGFE